MSTLKVTNIQHGSATNVAMVLDTAGTVKAYSTISVGNVTPSSSGAGITFPATASASSDANTLDDYEEGTWNPTINSAASLTMSSTNDTLSYTKVGRLVTITGSIGFTNQGAAEPGFYINNLPFAAANGSEGQFNSAGACLFYDSSASTYTAKTFKIDEDSLFVNFNGFAPNSIGNGDIIFIMATYCAAT